MKYREHRGGFKEAMATTVEINGKADIARIEGTTPEHITVEPYGDRIDPRNGWNTHIVCKDGNAIGWTDGPVD